MESQSQKNKAIWRALRHYCFSALPSGSETGSTSSRNSTENDSETGLLLRFHFLGLPERPESRVLVKMSFNCALLITPHLICEH